MSTRTNLILLWLTLASLTTSDAAVRAQTSPDASAVPPVTPVRSLREVAKPPVTREGLEVIIRALDSPEASIQVEAAKLCASAATAYEEKATRETPDDWIDHLIFALVRCTQSSDASVESGAMRALAGLGAFLSKACPSLQPRCPVGDDETLWFKARTQLAEIAKRNPQRMMPLLRDRDARLMSAAAFLLADLKYEPALPLLTRFLQSPKPEWRAFGVLGVSKWPNAQPLIAPFLGDPDERPRKCAVSEIEVTPAQFAELAARYYQSSLPFRRSIIELLVYDKSYLYLVEDACRESDSEIVQNALEIALIKGLKLPSNCLVPHLRHSEPRLRKEAWELIEHCADEALDDLLPFLQDRDHNLVIHAMIAMSYCHNARALEPIFRAYRRMKDEPSTDLAMAAALANIGPAAAKLTRRMLADPDEKIRLPALQASFKVLGAEAIGVMRPLLKDKDKRELAIDLLGKSGEPKCFPLLAECLKDPDDLIRTDAIDAMKELRDMRALALLEQLRSDRSKPVREAAESAIESLREPAWVHERP